MAAQLFKLSKNKVCEMVLSWLHVVSHTKLSSRTNWSTVFAEATLHTPGKLVFFQVPDKSAMLPAYGAVYFHLPSNWIDRWSVKDINWYQQLTYLFSIADNVRSEFQNAFSETLPLLEHLKVMTKLWWNTMCSCLALSNHVHTFVLLLRGSRCHHRHLCQHPCCGRQWH